MKKVVILSALILTVFSCSKKKSDDGGGGTSQETPTDDGVDDGPLGPGPGTVHISATLPASVDLDTAFAISSSGAAIPSFENAIVEPISAGKVGISIDNAALWLEGEPGTTSKDLTKGVMILAAKAGSDVFETGATMQFIEIPVAGENSLIKIPTDYIKGVGIEFGELESKNGDLIASGVAAEEITTLESGLLNELSGTDDGLKAARNSYMNGNLGAEAYLRPAPQYMFSGDLGAFYGTGKDGEFHTVEIGADKNTQMRSFLLRTSGRYDVLKIEDFCRANAQSETAAAKELLFYPPSKNNKGEAQAPELTFLGDFCDKTPESCPKRTVLTSKGSYISEANHCYSNFDDISSNFFEFKVQSTADGTRMVNFNWGSGWGFYGEIPSGLWDLKVKSGAEEKLIGRFDLASGYPLRTVGTTTYPVIYIPQIKIVRGADKRLTSAEIKWAMWNPAKGALEEVTDLTLFKSLIEEVSVSVDDHTETGSEDGENFKPEFPATGNVLTIDFTKAKKPWMLPDSPTGSTTDDATPEVEEFGIGYTLYGTTYLFGLRVKNIPIPD